MKQRQHYTGLTSDQVRESRLRHGANTLTPPAKATLWDKFKVTCKHWIARSMIVLTIAAVVFAALMSDHTGTSIWMMPLMMGASTLLILLVGLFGGFKDPLFKVLITAFVLSIGIAIYEYECDGNDLSIFLEPIGIIVALLLATGVAFFLERSNEKTFQSLNEVDDDTKVKVIRDDNVCQVPRRDIVVGDIVLLETGEEVPADCELLESINLIVNESSLTGEPQTNKTVDARHFDKEATYPSNHILKGTTILEGYCTARVTHVGDATESGKVYEAAQVEEGSPTPLSRKLNTLAQLITNASYTVAALVVIGRIMAYFIIDGSLIITSEEWLHFITYLLNTFMIAVTLIVVAVPEGLPMSVTLSLAFSMRKLMNEHTLPRTMHSCETMGAASVICTDKTGTLTQNQMRVAEAQTFVGLQAIAEMIALNTTANLDLSHADAAKAIGNPTEGALLLWLHDKDISYQSLREDSKILAQLPFTTENKYMATIVMSPVSGKRMLYVKGAPEIILGLSTLSDDERAAHEASLRTYQEKAMRTLALSFAEIPQELSEADIIHDGRLHASGMCLAGIFAISDPVRSDVPPAIRQCAQAGIQVKIVTGDTQGTAKEIGRQVGLWTDADGEANIMTGTTFAAMSDEALSPMVEQIKILARAKPTDKERLVHLLKRRGQVVAVTGDGTNDAPALNAADVGLSMGDGTAVAKEASDMTILDNSFSTIAHAVMWGRSLYKNIQRFIMYQMTINVVACLIVLIGAFTGTESPLTVTQMLWVNLIMDTFAAIALASLPPTASVMKDRPRQARDPIISNAMGTYVIGLGGLFTLILLVLLLAMQHADIHGLTALSHARYGTYDGLSAYELSLFFTIFVMLQFWNIFNAKAFKTTCSAFQGISQCRGFVLILSIIIIGQIMIVQLGGKMFNVTPLSPTDWLLIIVLTSPVMLIGEAVRWIQRHCFTSSSTNAIPS